MKIRLPNFAVSITMTVLLPLAGCSSDSGTEGTGPSVGGGSGVTTSGSSGESGATGLSSGTSSGAATGSSGSGNGANIGTAGGSSSGTSGGGTTASGSSSTQGGSDGGGGTTASSGSSTQGTSGGTDGSGSDGGDAIPPTFETFQKVIMAQACFGAGCHNDPQNPLNLTLNDQLYTRLTAATSKSCQNLKVINPGNPGESALVKLLNGPCGTLPQMPEGGNPIPADYVAAITTWIMNGAAKQ